MYLGVSPSVTNWSAAGDEFSLLLDSNPLTEFVELPDTCSNMRYSAILPGMVRGACEMVSRAREQKAPLCSSRGGGVRWTGCLFLARVWPRLMSGALYCERSKAYV